LKATSERADGGEHHDGTVPLSRPLKQKIRDGLVALSLANMCFLKVGFDLMYDTDRFFNKLPVTTPMLLALLVNITGVALLAWLVMQMLRRFSSRLLHLAAHLVFLLLLLLPVDFIRLQLTTITDYQIFVFCTRPATLVCELALLALIVWQHRVAAKIGAVVIGILSPLAIVWFAKITFICLGVISLEQCVTENVSPLSPGPVREGQPRVVWIIFDEMDYRLAFEQRPAVLHLPEFDLLRGQSLFATSAVPPADCTLQSMPSLILGRCISSVSLANTCDPSITFADTGATSTLSGHPSVFSEARALGFNTALVGWYIPYNRWLGDSLNFCEWYAYPYFEVARAETFKLEICLQIRSLAEAFNIRQLFVDMHRRSLRTSLSVVTNSTYGLVLLHLPAPHPPGVYKADKGKFTIWGMPRVGGYFNNVGLADHELGELRRAMETSGEWNKTWIIVSADHSWRGSANYDGRRDYRVAYLVKPPGTNDYLAYSRQFNTILTHDLILAILRGEVTNQPSTACWLDAHGTQTAPVTGGRQD
jgi:hypothetical protein